MKLVYSDLRVGDVFSYNKVPSSIYIKLGDSLILDIPARMTRKWFIDDEDDIITLYPEAELCLGEI